LWPKFEVLNVKASSMYNKQGAVNTVQWKCSLWAGVTPQLFNFITNIRT